MHMWFMLHFSSDTHGGDLTSLIFEIVANWSQQKGPRSTKNPGIS
jgi:hypothetical protein